MLISSGYIENDYNNENNITSDSTIVPNTNLIIGTSNSTIT